VKHGAAAAVGFDHAEAGGAGRGRINAQNPDARGLFGGDWHEE
jgi:hypothetical protein